MTAVALLGAVAIPATAWADARLEARRHFRAGMTLIQNGEYAKGIAELQEAWATKPHRNVLFNIARAYDDWKRPEEALEYYRRYLAARPPDAVEVQLAITRLERELERIAAQRTAAEQSEQQTANLKPAPEPAKARASSAAADPQTIEKLTELTERLEAAVAKAEAIGPIPLATPTEAGAGGEAQQPGVENLSPSSSSESADVAPYEEVVVTASRRAQTALEAPYATTIITSDEIRLSGATSLPELLRRVPGADVMRMGVGSANISFRGFNQRLANKVLVLIDGRPEYHDFLGLTFWSALPVGLEEISRIEVIRGPGSALYGANAMLGIINIITREPGTGPRGEFNLTGGTGNVAAGSYVSSGGTDRVRYRASVAYEQADKWSRDYADGRPDIRFNYGNSALGLRSARANLDARWFVQRGVEVGAAAGVNQSYMEVYPYGLLRNFALEGLTSYTKADVTAGPVKVKLFWNHLNMDSGPQYEPIGQRSLLTHVRSNVFDVEALYSQEFMLLGRHNFVVGVSGRLKNVDWDYLEEPQSELHAAAFIQEEWRIVDPFRIVASWRLDRHPLLDGGEPGIAQSPRLAALWMPFEGHAFHASYATAFRAPTFLESYVGIRVPVPGVPGASALTRGNTALKPERLTAYELGYHGEKISLGLEWDLAVYQHEVKDLIGLGPINPVPAGEAYDPKTDTYLLGRSHFQNEPALYTARGAELGVKLSPVDRVDLKLSAAVQTISASGVPEDAICGPCSQAPTARIFGGVTWRTPVSLDLSVDGTWTSSSTWIEREPSAADPSRSESLSYPLSAYAVMNARVGYRLLNDRMVIAIAGSHMLSAHQEHPFGNMIERRVFGTLTVTP
ncbi:MAG: TonB-dependent receptor [Myxococcaceae bacterium]